MEGAGAEHPEIDLRRSTLAGEGEPDVDVEVADLARGVPVAFADVDEPAGERVDLVAGQSPERTREVHAALGQRQSGGELLLVERVRIADRERAATLRSAIAASPISSGVSSSATRPLRAFLFQASGAQVAGACLRIVAPEQQPRRPQERDAVAPGSGASLLRDRGMVRGSSPAPAPARG